MRTILVVLVALLVPSSSATLARFRLWRCPQKDGDTKSFRLTRPTSIRIQRTSGNSLCTLGIEQADGSIQPIARSYDGHDWERAGGSLASTLSDWTCGGWRKACRATLPPNTKYVLHTRVAADFKLWRGKFIPLLRPKAPSSGDVTSGHVARFLEQASFGATPTDLNQPWDASSFASYIQKQSTIPPTYHREQYRRRVNPAWYFHHPEFAAQLDPCSLTAGGTTWRRRLFTVKDKDKTVTTRRFGTDRWEIVVDGYVRSRVTQLRWQNANAVNQWQVTDGMSYRYCSSDDETRRGIYKLTILGVCRPLVAEDVSIDFAPSDVPPGALPTTVAPLSDATVW